MSMTSTGAMDATATMDMPQETSAAAMDMGGMGNGCQISVRNISFFRYIGQS